MCFQTLIEDEPEKYQSHFSEYIKRGLEADNLEEMYKKVHAAIRAEPSPKKSEKQPPKKHKRSDYTFILFNLISHYFLFIMHRSAQMSGVFKSSGTLALFPVCLKDLYFLFMLCEHGTYF